MHSGRNTEEQIAHALGQAKARMKAGDICRKLGIYEHRSTSPRHAHGQLSGYPCSEGLLERPLPENRWAEAAVRAAAAAISARASRRDSALAALASVMPAIERGAGGMGNYTAIVYWATEALWLRGRHDFADVIERNLGEKTIARDFR